MVTPKPAGIFLTSAPRSLKFWPIILFSDQAKIAYIISNCSCLFLKKVFEEPGHASSAASSMLRLC